MSKLLSHKFFKEYTDTEWRVLKACLCIVWFGIIRHAALNPDKVLYPCGICSVLDCNFLLVPHLSILFTVASVLLSIFYIAEKRMEVTTLLMFLISLICFTLEESNGILNRSGLYTLVFLAQSLAYFRNKPDLKTERVQFAVQFIAAGYMLAGISKLHETGWNWVNESPQASLQMLKGYCAVYFNFGEISQLQTGLSMAAFAMHHALVVKMLFGSSLLLELFAWVAVKNKTYALVYGLLLTAMHAGIFYFMHIIIVAIFYPMVLFMVNPVYMLYLLYAKAKQIIFV